MAKVLVVDDSLFTRLNICKILHEYGHETVEAANGVEGLKRVTADRPDIVFSDLLMPEMDGIGFLKAMQEMQITLPVVILSADIQETKRQQCLDLGTARFISKPPRKSDIQDAVIELVPTSAA